MQDGRIQYGANKCSLSVDELEPWVSIMLPSAQLTPLDAEMEKQEVEFVSGETISVLIWNVTLLKRPMATECLFTVLKF